MINRISKYMDMSEIERLVGFDDVDNLKVKEYGGTFIVYNPSEES